jgi:pimeloyl-ACP methyl ester carboxylesterase
MTTAPTTDATPTRIRNVTGAGGVQLRVDETGNPSGRAVLFLHGVSQNRLAWRKQLHSDLADDHRLVAMDLRGHGESDGPADAYKDSAAWAQDVHAVIKSLDLEQPILSGWSYGGVVICDYLRHYGQNAVGGIHLVDATTRLGEPALPFLAPQFVSLIPGLCSPDVEESTSTLKAFMTILTCEKLSPEDFYLFLGYNTVVAPRVRRDLLSRTVDNDDLLAQIDTPVLVTHGLEDTVVLPSMAEHNARVIPHARASYYAGVGHAPFWEDPARFNAELRGFAASL